MTEKMKPASKSGMSNNEDNEMLMDHMALEAIHAVHAKDHEKFKNSFRAMLSHHMNSIEEAEEGNK